jgi:ABC-2 type transport system permease protein
MNLVSQALVIARRDFVSIVATPTFLLFLLAPLMMIGFGLIGGMSAKGMAESADSQERIVAVVPESERAAFIAVDARLRDVAGGAGGPPDLVVMPSAAASREAALETLRRDADVLAILEGSAAAPRIGERRQDGFAGRYLATLAETVTREGATAAARGEAASKASFTLLPASGTGRVAQSGLGYGAVFAIFLLTLLLAGQSVGMLAEEKSNKVIEILAAAVRLEAVFFGKLLGMLGVALLFVSFWGVLLGAGAVLVLSQIPAGASTMLTLTPAIGWPLFLGLGLVYFLSAFLLLGGVFLGVGAQASTVREIQMLSLPITFFQIGMFTLSTAAANNPDSGVATVAQMLPWSSPFAMAARGATDAALWPHLAALGWQALWIAITIWLGVRLFRSGVLRSGGSWWPWAKPAAAAGAATAAVAAQGSS